MKTKGQYFYQVALDGNVAGKENKRSLTSSEQTVLKLTALQSMSMVTKTVNQTWTTS
ncbi:hypothetical protein PCS8106_02476 [Streptococcus pneumoniae PCS8106]|nr:hypothetical protein PCS8106_02476 [Streptococcus pneumoniae PCS8106]